MVAHHSEGHGGAEGEVAIAAGPPRTPPGGAGRPGAGMAAPSRSALSPRLCSARLGPARPGWVGLAAVGDAPRSAAEPRLRVCLTQRGRRGKSHLRPPGPGAAGRGRSRAHHPAAVPALSQRPPPGPRRRPAPARYYGSPSAPRGRAGRRGRWQRRQGAGLGPLPGVGRAPGAGVAVGGSVEVLL